MPSETLMTKKLYEPDTRQEQVCEYISNPVHTLNAEINACIWGSLITELVKMQDLINVIAENYECEV